MIKGCVLGIESSCDETAAAVVMDGRKVLSNIISSQIDIHKRFGGVVPEIASRNHTLIIETAVGEALSAAGVTLEDIEGVAVTYGAGLQGALLIGLTFAKGLCYALDKKLIGVNHIMGHIAANYISHRELEPPFICLVVSGGHTAIVHIKDYTEHEVLGSTLDDAVGEAFDKVARCLGLSYPGGPNIDRLAAKGRNNIEFPKMLKGGGGYNFSYSGLKTAVINYLHNSAQKNETPVIEDVCASFQCAAIDVLAEKAVKACREKNISRLAAAGGVSANSYLRKTLKEKCSGENISLYLPDSVFCTDNAAMIAAEGYIRMKNGMLSGMDLNVNPSLKI